jgi:hypothetical protein
MFVSAECWSHSLHTLYCIASLSSASASVRHRPIALGDDVLETAAAGNHGQHVLDVRYLPDGYSWQFRDWKKKSQACKAIAMLVVLPTTVHAQ